MAANDRLPYFKLYAIEYLGRTRMLTAAQKGILLDLWAYAWVEGSLENDRDALGRLTGGTGADVNAVLARHFELDETTGRWVSRRLEEERQKALDAAEERRRKAKLAAEARWGGRNE